ncbi:MAG: hypothetical protein ACTS6H_01280 [Candidatus Hodgkinia cicadicola]
MSLRTRKSFATRETVAYAKLIAPIERRIGLIVAADGAEHYSSDGRKGWK